MRECVVADQYSQRRRRRPSRAVRRRAYNVQRFSDGRIRGCQIIWQVRCKNQTKNFIAFLSLSPSFF
ncbi:hypothetical protein HanIR_Chr03g0100691 [Helianthus annuus]|nr:hypothetical protein HanIR_Chr03g0100691 [Helianthus annuus]